jgi:hypothetical protein
MSTISSDNKKFLNFIREVYSLENEIEIDIEIKINEIISKYLKKSSKNYLNLDNEILDNFFTGF